MEPLAELSREQVVRAAAQELSKGCCHHTGIDQMRTIEAILGEVYSKAYEQAVRRYGQPLEL